jgi:uncharacterized membrane protein YkvA (DUF1232 family)
MCHPLSVQTTRRYGRPLWHLLGILREPAPEVTATAQTVLARRGLTLAAQFSHLWFSMARRDAAHVRHRWKLTFLLLLAGLGGAVAAPLEYQSPLIRGTYRSSLATSAQPIEESLRWGTAGLLRTVGWGYRKIVQTVRGSFRAWLRLVARTAVLLAVAIAASMVDTNLWQQWRLLGLRLLQTYVPSAALVYVLTVFDRRADRVGRWALLAALGYGVLPWDLLPDRLRAGLAEDIVLVAMASRWFMARCAGEVVEQHALRVQRWQERTRQIRAYRRRIGRGSTSDLGA